MLVKSERNLQEICLRVAMGTRDIPLKIVKNQKPENETQKSQTKSDVSPYDIILGNVELSYERIPEFMYISN